MADRPLSGGDPRRNAARSIATLPLALWLGAAALTVALSFTVFAVALRRPAAYRSFSFLRLHPIALGALRAASLSVLLGVIAAGLFGAQDPFRNFAPAFVWIAWWIGFTYLCAVFGDLWTLINPWYVLRARGVFKPAPALGAWPAVALLLAFAWIEIVWQDNALPANVAWLALGYLLATWAGMLLFGADAWLARCEVFTVYFGFISRLAPVEIRADGKVRLRAPATGLLDPRGVSSSQAAFVIVMLSIVTFDGLRETPLWAVDDAHWTAAATAGLLVTPCLFALVVYGTCALMGRLSDAPAGELARLFADVAADRAGLPRRPLPYVSPGRGAARDPARLRSARPRMGLVRHCPLPGRGRDRGRALRLVYLGGRHRGRACARHIRGAQARARAFPNRAPHAAASTRSPR